jgi:ribosomal protein L27
LKKKSVGGSKRNVIDSNLKLSVGSKRNASNVRPRHYGVPRKTNEKSKSGLVC